MSGFMSYLDNIEDEILSETEEVVASPKKKKEVAPKNVSKKTVKKAPQKRKVVTPKPKVERIQKSDAVAVVENRLRNKLDSIGLNEKVIDSVVSSVLTGVYDIDIPSVTETAQSQSTPRHEEVLSPMSISSRAGSILEGVPEISQPSTVQSNDQSIPSMGKVSETLSRASMLV